MAYERPLGLCMGSVRGELTDHSYHTFLALESLQKLTSTCSPHLTSIGSLMGTKMGNQLNMPGEWVRGCMLIIVFP